MCPIILSRYIDHKSALDNAKIFVNDIEDYRDAINMLSDVSDIIVMYADAIEQIISDQRLVSNKIISSTLTQGILTAIEEYCKNTSYKIDDLINVIVFLIKPYTSGL